MRVVIAGLPSAYEDNFKTKVILIVAECMTVSNTYIFYRTYMLFNACTKKTGTS